MYGKNIVIKIFFLVLRFSKDRLKAAIYIWINFLKKSKKKKQTKKNIIGEIQQN